MSIVGKVILCGSAGAGKTSILAQYVDGHFFEEYKQTIGANFIIKEIEMAQIVENIKIKDDKVKSALKDKGVKLYLWDIGGQKDKLFANEYYFNQASGAFVIFSIDSLDSFAEIDFWISKLKELSGDVPYILVGNKSDLPRVIDKESAQKKADEHGVEYIETSAKLNENVNKAFEILSLKLLNNLILKIITN